jgi:hypothetical protein
MKTFLLLTPLVFTKELEVEINDKCIVNGTTYFDGNGGGSGDDKQKSNFIEDSICFTTKTTEITKDSFQTNTNYYKNSSIKDEDDLFFTFFAFFIFFL